MTKQEKTALLASGTNLFLTVVKFTLASVSGSLALLAEAYHSFSDICSSFLVFWAMRKDRLAPSSPQTQLSTPQKHLFREGAWEAKAALGIGIALLIASINILAKVRQTTIIDLRYQLPVAAAFFGLAFVSYLVYRFEVSVGEETDSAGLLADGYHARVDGLTTSFVGASLLSDYLGWKIDRIAAAVIGIMILSTALRVLRRALGYYLSDREERDATEAIVFEDIFVSGIALVARWLQRLPHKVLPFVPGYERDREKALRRLAWVSALLLLSLLLAVYLASGFFTVQTGQRAIVELFGDPKNLDKPLGPGLHYLWPWPVGRVNRVNCAEIRSKIVGYQSIPGEEMILWTNVHYLTPYTVITGENSFCEVAMALHYKIRPENLGDFLYTNAGPETVLFTLSHRTLRETFGVREFFSTITTNRDQVELLIAEKIQAQADSCQLGIDVVNVCLRDVHPSVNVAPAFEDVVSAMEDLETYIERAKSQQKSLVIQARGEKEVKILKAKADNLNTVRGAEGQAQAFLKQSSAYKATKDVTAFRLRMELLSETLPPLEKYILTSGCGDFAPDLWTGTRMPALAAMRSSQGRDTSTKPTTYSPADQVSREEDVLELLREHQKEVYPQ